MAFNVQTFKSQIDNSGFIQSNKYEVTVYPPAAISGASMYTNETSYESYSSNMDTARDMTLRAINATLPGLAIKTADTNRHGVGVFEKIPFGAAYTDTTITFICDRYGDIYKFWYGWLNFVFGATGQDAGARSTVNRPMYTSEYKDNYAGRVAIDVYSNDGQLSLTYMHYKAYPISINETPVSWDETNTLLKLTTTLTFKEWSFEGVTMRDNSQRSNPETPSGPLTNTNRPNTMLA